MELLRRRVLPLALVFSAALSHQIFAAEVLPPKPPAYFNDYANVVPKDKALALNEKLAQFERETSNQVVVAVYRKMQSDSSIDDYAQRIAQSWGVGQKGQSGGNGVVLLVFIDDRKMSIQVGYGLEGTLPDITAFDIRSRHINPRFRTGDYTGGLAEGIDLILKAIRGEYKGDGATAQEKTRSSPSSGCGPLGFLIMLIIVLSIIRLGRRRGGYGYTGLGGPIITSGWGSGWSGGSSSSSSSGGGFSGFSGGGGSFGGGGSSGSW
ncbi:MAG TPA: TPM domain-containing protein [Chthoniobacterales bacterium]|nr:TPM domain-containing protein [Chthoniobacterales bacterium]